MIAGCCCCCCWCCLEIVVYLLKVVFVFQVEAQNNTMVEHFDQNDSKEVLKVKEKERVKNWRRWAFEYKKKTQQPT